MTTLRELQTNLPWTIRYSQDFRSSPMAHKDFAHTLHHVSKASGMLHALVDDMDHDRQVADGGQPLREKYEKYVADLVVCALRIANTFPGGVIDLERAVIDRIESKNNVKLVTATCGATHRMADEVDTQRVCIYCGESIKVGQAIYSFDKALGLRAGCMYGITVTAHVGCGPR